MRPDRWPISSLAGHLLSLLLNFSQEIKILKANSFAIISVMRDVMKVVYTFWAMLLLAVILVGSPLAIFGCHTIVPDQFQVPCETTFGETAVQNNFIQPITPIIAVLVLLTFVCWLKPQHQAPQELYLLPPLPPPRSFV